MFLSNLVANQRAPKMMYFLITIKIDHCWVEIWTRVKFNSIIISCSMKTNMANKIKRQAYFQSNIFHISFPQQTDFILLWDLVAQGDPRWLEVAQGGPLTLGGLRWPRVA